MIIIPGPYRTGPLILRKPFDRPGDRAVATSSRQDGDLNVSERAIRYRTFRALGYLSGKATYVTHVILYTCMYICIYTCVYIYIYIYLFIHVCLFLFCHIHVYISLRLTERERERERERESERARESKR